MKINFFFSDVEIILTIILKIDFFTDHLELFFCYFIIFECWG